MFQGVDGLSYHFLSHTLHGFPGDPLHNRLHNFPDDCLKPLFGNSNWNLVYRKGPLTLPAVQTLTAADPTEIEAALDRLVKEGRVCRDEQPEGPLFSSGAFYVPLDAQAGWEAAVYDHYQALVQTICAKLRMNGAGATADDEVGGSTYTLDIWPGHPLEKEARASLRRFRDQMSDLRARIKLYNNERGLPDAGQ